MAQLIRVLAPDDSPVPLAVLEILDSSMNFIGYTSPTDSDGITFTSLTMGSYYLIANPHNKKGGSPRFPINVVSNSYQEFDYKLDPTNVNYDIVSLNNRLNLLSVSFSDLYKRIHNSLTKQEVSELLSYLNELVTRSDIRLNESRDLISSSLEKIQESALSSGSNLFASPVATESNLPSSDQVGTVRVVISNSGNAGNPSIFVKKSSGWVVL